MLYTGRYENRKINGAYELFLKYLEYCIRRIIPPLSIPSTNIDKRRKKKLSDD